MALRARRRTISRYHTALLLTPVAWVICATMMPEGSWRYKRVQVIVFTYHRSGYKDFAYYARTITQRCVSKTDSFGSAFDASAGGFGGLGSLGFELVVGAVDEVAVAGMRCSRWPVRDLAGGVARLADDRGGAVVEVEVTEVAGRLPAIAAAAQAFHGF